MEGALRDAERRLFKPEMEKIVMMLCASDTARVARTRLDALVFEAFTAFYDEMLLTIDLCRKEPEEVYSLLPPVIDSARFLWERVLDLPYGRLEIVRPEEALPLIYRLLTTGTDAGQNTEVTES